MATPHRAGIPGLPPGTGCSLPSWFAGGTTGGWEGPPEVGKVTGGHLVLPPCWSRVTQESLSWLWNVPRDGDSTARLGSTPSAQAPPRKEFLPQVRGDVAVTILRDP